MIVLVKRWSYKIINFCSESYKRFYYPTKGLEPGWKCRFRRRFIETLSYLSICETNRRWCIHSNSRKVQTNNLRVLKLTLTDEIDNLNYDEHEVLFWSDICERSNIYAPEIEST